MAPLVLGGELHPGKPIGGKAALALGVERTSIVDNQTLSAAQMARVRLARKLAPVDVMFAPTAEDWALGAVLHDIVQSTHPGFDGAFRANAPLRLLNVAELTLARIAPVKSVGEALSRHTWFSRALEIGRTDTKVSWWVGSQTFLGTEPPKRLQAWPDLRRVRVDRDVHKLADLPSHGSRVAPDKFASALTAFLGRTPLTDVATCARLFPLFQWSPASIALAGTRAGRTLAVRALADGVQVDVDAALGRATKALVAGRAVAPLVVSLGLLGERAMAAAQERVTRNEAPTGPSSQEDVAIARALGAWAAMQQIGVHGELFHEDERASLLAQLRPLAPETLVAPVAALVGPVAA